MEWGLGWFGDGGSSDGEVPRGCRRRDAGRGSTGNEREATSELLRWQISRGWENPGDRIVPCPFFSLKNALTTRASGLRAPQWLSQLLDT